MNLYVSMFQVEALCSPRVDARATLRLERLLQERRSFAKQSQGGGRCVALRNYIVAACYWSARWESTRICELVQRSYSCVSVWCWKIG